MGTGIFSEVFSSVFSLLALPFIGIVIKVIVILAIVKVALKLNTKLFEQATIKLKAAGQIKNVTYLSFLKHVAIAIIYFIAGIAIAQNIPGLSSATSALLASTGVLTVVVGFASQEAMSNIVSGIMVLAFQPFVIGDVINFNGTVGTVEEISLRHTVIKTLENKRLIVPNGSMNSNVIENANFIESKVCAFLDVGISYESSIDQAREIIVKHCRNHKDYLDNRTPEDVANRAPEVLVRVTELGDSAVSLRAWIWAKDGGTAFAMKCDLLESVKKDFDKQGINIPYPHVTVTQK